MRMMRTESEKLKFKLNRETSFDGCTKLMDRAIKIRDYAVANEILTKSFTLAKKYQNWKYLYEISIEKSPQEIKALKMMRKTARSFDECSEVAVFFGEGSFGRWLMLNKMKKQADTFVKWLFIYDLLIGQSKKHSWRQRRVVKELRSRASSFEHWDVMSSIWKARRNNRLMKMAFEQMARLAYTFKEWNTIMLAIYEQGFVLLEKIVIEEMFLMANTDEQFKTVWLYSQKSSPEIHRKVEYFLKNGIWL